jgi:DNA repair protein RecO
VVPVIAKGARSPRSRLGAAVDPFRRLDVTYYDKPGREIQTLSQAEVLSDHRDILASLERLEAAGQWFRFLRALLPDGAPAEPIYALAVEALERLERLPVGRIARWQAYHRAAAANRLGLAAQLDGCMGLACAACAGPGRSWSALSGDEYAVLTLYHHPDWTLLEELDELGADEVRVQDLVLRFVAWHADVRPPAGTAR